MKIEDIKVEFMQKIQQVTDKCTGHETYGNTTEFFDEDGIVLMTAIEDGSGKITFAFSEDLEETYEFDDVNTEE